MNILIFRIVLLCICVSLTSEYILKGTCPKINSNSVKLNDVPLNSLFQVPFKIFTPNYLVLPSVLLERIHVTSYEKNILTFEPSHSHCKTAAGIRFDNQTEQLEVMAVSLVKNKNRFYKTEIDIKCRIKLNFDLAMIVTEHVGVVWGCSEINETHHDEAAILFSVNLWFFNLTSYDFAAKSIKLLENRSLLTLDMFKEHSQIDVSSDVEFQTKLCPNINCTLDYFSLYNICVGAFFITLIVVIVILMKMINLSDAFKKLRQVSAARY